VFEAKKKQRAAKVATNPELEAAWKDFSAAVQSASLEGSIDCSKEVWEQGLPALQYAWLRVTDPSNLESLRLQIGTGGNPDGERMIIEAHRQAEIRAKLKN
jgi:hypothetical protein